jgi:guanylate kinase
MIHPLVTVTGPSGSGKTTIVQNLVKKGLALEAVSSTTRKPRAGEVEGVAYYFRTIDQFRHLLNIDGFYECVNFNGNWYGSEKTEVDDKAMELPVLIVVEPEGVRHFQQNYRLGPMFHVFLEVEWDHCLLRMLERGDPEDRATQRNNHDKEYFPKSSAGIKWDLVIRNYSQDRTSKAVSSLF